MVGERVHGPGGGNRRGKRKSKRNAPGLTIVPRDGTWHIHGTVRLRGLDGGRRSVRIRKGTGLPAIDDTYGQAETLRDTWALEVRNQVIHGVQPSRPLSVALEKFLQRPRKHGRKVGFREVAMTQAIARAFGIRLLTEIAADEWQRFADNATATVAASTRERYLNGLMSFLNWCARKPRLWLTEKTIPHFERDAEARKPQHRQRRRVAELRPDLIQLLIESSGWHLKPQLWVEWSTGQRVSAVLRLKLADAVLAPGREQVTFGKTKTGKPVTASLHPAAGEAVREYLKKRGRLWDREGPLFLTKFGKPYRMESEQSGHNKTAFNNARGRAVKILRRRALQHALELRRQRRVEDAKAVIGQALSDIRLLRQVTQHWFRHLLATTMMALKASVRDGMDQGGWLTVESYMAYAHDVPAMRRAIVDQLPTPAPVKKESA